MDDLSLLYGIMAGDGCLSRGVKNRTISITCNYYNDIPFFDEIVIPLLNRIRKKETKYRLRPKYGKIEIDFSEQYLSETEIEVSGTIEDEEVCVDDMDQV